MTVIEFLAWFEGYTEGMEHRPNEMQWERIKGQIKKLGPSPVVQQPYHLQNRLSQVGQDFGRHVNDHGNGSLYTAISGG